MRRKCRCAVGLVAISLPALALPPSPSLADHSPRLLGAPAGAYGAGLDPQHASEHAAVARILARRQRQLESLTRAQLRAKVRRERQAGRQFAARTTGKRKRVGAWTTEPFRLPNYAIHAVMLPTGKVLFWGYPPLNGGGTRANLGVAAVWDPSRGTNSAAFNVVNPPVIDPDGSGPQSPGAAPIYCSGQSLLPNGDVLAAGGNLVWAQNDPDDPYTIDSGLKAVFTFDPWAEEWTQQPSMAAGRWYPSQVLLADGRTAILGGYTDEPPGAQNTDDLEIFTPASANGGVGTVDLRDEAPRETQLYPHLFTLPDGDALLAGPGSSDSAFLGTSAGGDFDWSDLLSPGPPRYGGNAVLLPGKPRGSWRVTQIGGYGGTPNANQTRHATATTKTFNARRPGQGWQPDGSQHIGRSYENTVLLPDGSMVTIGGGLGYTIENRSYAVDSQGSRRRVELFDPRRDKWRLGPAQLEDRAYHSTAVLLPDGRVWSAGDDLHGPMMINGQSERDTAEIYSPPYLFEGRRPKLRRPPNRVRWGDVFGIRTKRKGKAASARRAVLVAPSATTHGADMHQRVVRLRLKRRYGRKGIDVVSPPRPGVAPPGYYMLFALSKRGVPSVARWVRLDPDAPNAPRISKSKRNR